MKARVGANCSGCGRWRPRFAKACSQCKLPAPIFQIGFLAEFLGGDSGGTRPHLRVSKHYHEPRVKKPRPKRAKPATPHPKADAVHARTLARVPTREIALELSLSQSTVCRIRKRFLDGSHSKA